MSVTRCNNDSHAFLHHDQRSSVQGNFVKQVSAFVASFEELGNPFTDDTDQLVVLDTKVIGSNANVQALYSADKIGSDQYNLFVKERFVDRTKNVNDPIPQNKLVFFSRASERRKVNPNSKLAAARNDCNLFSRLFIACQTRSGHLDVFFQHENQLYPSSISDNDTVTRSCQTAANVQQAQNRHMEYPKYAAAWKSSTTW